ncbi:MAG: ABC transporter substrate-binding protein, partial [Chloroflexi bacterium]|nr:ABC transporter substrate-binding protein [Chloroflexota bacterium]
TSSNLPLYLAADKGYFKDAGVDVELDKLPASSTAMLPVLATGEIDMLAAVPAPAFYNQELQGFAIKVVTSMGEQKPGRLVSTTLSVVTSQANSIKELSDLRGKTISVGVQGTPNDITATEAVRQAGLTPGKDVTLHYGAASPADMLTMAKSGGADVIGIPEPTATQAVKQGLVVRWKTSADIVPWYQASFIAASSKFLQDHPDAATAFAKAVVRAARDINATNGTWTPDLTAAEAKWLGVEPDIVTAQGGVPYYDPNLAVSTDSLQRVQDIWFDSGQVKQKVDIKQLVDSGPLNSALSQIGK